MTQSSKPGIPRIAIWGSVCLAVLAAAFLAISLYWDPAKARSIFQIVLVFLAVLAVCLFLAWLVRALFQWAADRHVRKVEAKTTDRSSGIPASRQSEFDTLADQIAKAVRLLRESRLGSGRTSAEALYSLPWILMLGPPGSGKTAMLRECGVEFPYSSADRRRRGEEELRGCEFWFSRKAVILDLSGRIAFDPEHVALFEGFLRLLRRVRKARPLDSVLVTVPLTGILGQGREEILSLAKGIRQRCDTMLRELGVRLPVYLIFTHCDALEGFSAYFGNLRSRDRAQVWGATIARSQRKRLPADQIFRKEFDLLVESLRDLRLQLLSTEKDSYKLAQIYTFPAHVANVREKLVDFIDTFLQPTPYSERPIFRGFYLTSAAERKPPENLRSEAPLRWDPARPAVAAKEDDEHTTSYFLEHLFTHVIFADRQLARRSVDTRVKRRGWMDIVAVSSILACTVFLVGMIVSFMENRWLISSTQNVMLAASQTVSNGKDLESMRNLDLLRQKVEELEGLERRAWSTWWRYGWGLSRIGEIREASKGLYSQKLDEIYVKPAHAQLIRRLRLFASQSGASFNYDQQHRFLQAYLMLTRNPEHFDEAFIRSNLAELWKEVAPADPAIALESLRFYAREAAINRRTLPTTPDDNELIESTQMRLASNAYSELDRKYSNLISEGNAKLSTPFTLEQATHGKSNFLTAKYEVPGVFTLQGWTSYLRGAVAELSKGVYKEDWVLGKYAPKTSGEISEAAFQQQILGKYFEEYGQHWQKFLESVSVRRFESYSDILQALDAFIQADSGLLNLLRSVAENTKIPQEVTGRIAQAAVKSAAGAGLALPPSQMQPQELLAQQFGPLHELVLPVGQQPVRIAGYIQDLDRLRQKLSLLAGTPTWDQMKAFVAKVITDLSGNEFRDAANTCQQIKDRCSNAWTTPVGILLDQPLQYAWSVVLRASSAQLEAQWASQVRDGFDREVASMFPFRQDSVAGAELPRLTFAGYFKPREGILSVFGEKEIAPLTSTRAVFSGGSSLFPPLERSAAFDEFMRRVSEIQGVFFADGPEPKVQFEVTTPDGIPGLESCMLDIGGDRLLYQNGVPERKIFSWPGPSARLQTRPIGGKPQDLSFTGDWALFKLIQKASIRAQSPGIFAATWNLQSSASPLTYRFRLISVQKNPFAREFFSDLRCPERIVQLPGTLR